MFVCLFVCVGWFGLVWFGLVGWLVCFLGFELLFDKFFLLVINTYLRSINLSIHSSFFMIIIID